MSSPPPAFRWTRLAAALGAWLILIYFMQHRSAKPAVLDRWSSGFTILIGLWGLVTLGLTALCIPGPRAWLYRHRFRGLAFTLGLLGALGLTEILLRTVDPTGLSYVGEMRRYIGLRQEHPELVYTQPKNTSVELDGVAVQFNSLGLRGAEIDPDPEVKRILFLGDSVVFGWGVPEEHTFVKRMALRLTGQTQTKWQGINAGVCSYNTEQEELYLRTQGLALEPDLVVLVCIDNDVLTYSDQWKKKAAEHKRSPIQRLKGALRGSFTYRFGQAALRDGFGGISTQGAERGVDPSDPGWSANMQALSRLIALCEERGVPLAIYHFRWSSNPWSDRYLAGIRDAAGAKPVIDTAPWFSDEPLPSWVNSQTDSHPNRRAHNRTAAKLLQTVNEQELLQSD